MRGIEGITIDQSGQLGNPRDVPMRRDLSQPFHAGSLVGWIRSESAKRRLGPDSFEAQDAPSRRSSNITTPAMSSGRLLPASVSQYASFQKARVIFGGPLSS